MSRNMMVRTGLAAAGLFLACAADAHGQVRVSGIEHLPLGSATLGTPVERRLPVSNLGSSGQDGVELHLDSAFGGAMSLDLDGLLAPSPEAREIRIRHKGWDGLIYGRARLASRPPDGTPGSSLEVECDFSLVSATTVRVRARDQFGNVVLNSVRPGSSITCTASVVSPPGAQLSCRLAIKTKGLPVQRNQQLSVALPEGPWTITGLSSVALHDVAVLEFEPEQCSACDTWLGTESALITSVGLPSIVVSDASLGTFGVSSHALGGADVDEDCDDFTDCDNVRRLHVSNIGSSGQDGVAIDLDDDGVGGSVAYTRGCCRGHVITMKAFDDAGGEVSRLSQVDDDLTGGTVVTCDATATGATEMQVTFRDSGGAVLHSSREFTGVLALACTGGPDGDARRCECVHGVWSLSTSAADTYVLPDGTPVSGASSVHFYPVGGTSTSTGLHSLHFVANDIAGPIDIRPITDAPSAVRVGGIQGVAMDKGLIAQQPDGTVIVSSPCCLDDDSDGDGIEMRTFSATGGTVTVDAGPLLTSTGEIKIKHKGWDGLIYGTHRLVGGGGGGAGGSIGLDCDFTPMGAVEIQWEARDADGALLGSGSVAGSTLGGVTVTPDPTASLLMPALMKAKEKANRTRCSMVIPDRDCDVDGLGSATLHNVRSIEFTPIEPAGSPPWGDLDAMQVTFAGMPSLHVLDASLLTFGVVGNGIKDVQVGEVCDDGNNCDESRKIRVDNLGSSGQDGVAFRFGNPLITEVALPAGVEGASMSLARGSCCRGHVIIMKLYDDQDQEAARVSNSSDEGGTSHTLSFDGAASGVEGFTFVLRDASDAVLASVDIFGSGGDISYVGPCDASSARAFSFDAASIRMELCESPVTVFLQGTQVAGVSSVSMDCRSGMQWMPSSLTGMDLTGNPTDFIEISNFSVIEAAPPCAADFDGNGVREVPDIFAFLSAWFAQVPAAYNFGGATGVPAIFAFLTVWFAGCP